MGWGCVGGGLWSRHVCFHKARPIAGDSHLCGLTALCSQVLGELATWQRLGGASWLLGADKPWVWPQLP